MWIEFHRPLAWREHGIQSVMGFWHGRDMMGRVTPAPGVKWSMAKDTLVKIKTILCCCCRQQLLTSSVSATLGYGVPAPQLVALRDVDPDNVGTAACRHEGGGKGHALTGQSHGKCGLA